MIKSGTILSVLTLLFVHLLFAGTVHAQLWHALPTISETANKPDAQFSNDEKKVFYLTGNGKVENLWSAVVADKWGRIIAGPKNPPIPITKFIDHGVVRFFHLLGSPEILYMRATDNGKDYHIYQIADDGSGTPQDLTPGPDGVTNIIIGASYNGRYVYYTSNKVNRDKVDVYRYDTQQYTSEDVFPNDKDFVALAWSRDQTKLLLQRPSTGQLFLYDMETTERDPITLPSADPLTEALFDPTSQNIVVLQKHGDATIENERAINASQWTASNEHADWIDYSPSGKYQISRMGTTWQVMDMSSHRPLALPATAHPLAFASKETMLLYAIPSPNATEQLYLYSIPLKSETLLSTLQ